MRRRRWTNAEVPQYLALERAEIIQLLKKLSMERHVTIISATHDIKMLNVSDQVVWIRDGRVDKVEDREELSISIGQIEIRK